MYVVRKIYQHIYNWLHQYVQSWFDLQETKIKINTEFIYHYLPSLMMFFIKGEMIAIK